MCIISKKEAELTKRQNDISLYFLLYVCKSHLAWRTQADWCLCLKFQTWYSQWKHFTWRIIVVNFAGNLLKSPCQQNSQLDRGRIRPPPTRQASSPAPMASSWSWQGGSHSCSTENVVMSIKITSQIVASWPGNPQQTLCPSSPGQKDTLPCSWEKRSPFLDKFSLCSYIYVFITIEI